MINILLGLPGAGKTYVLTRKAYECVMQGRPIYPFRQYQLNVEKGGLFYPFKRYIHYWDTTEELIKLERGVILMDEAQVWFNSRTWQDLDVRLQYKLQQHRKDGLDIIGTCQSETRLDPVMRELVTHYYLCRKLISSAENAKRVFGIIRVSVYYPEDIKKTQKVPAAGEWYLLRKQFCNGYDTNAKIAIEEKIRPLKHIEYACEVCGKKHIKHR